MSRNGSLLKTVNETLDDTLKELEQAKSLLVRWRHADSIAFFSGKLTDLAHETDVLLGEACPVCGGKDGECTEEGEKPQYYRPTKSGSVL